MILKWADRRFVDLTDGFCEEVSKATARRIEEKDGIKRHKSGDHQPLSTRWALEGRKGRKPPA